MVFVFQSQYDSDLDAPDVPETWSELVDKKVQRKMHAKDIKRQDVIYGKYDLDSCRMLNAINIRLNLSLLDYFFFCYM